MFENGNTRYKRKDLPASYEATATFQDNRGQAYTEKYILDFRLYYDYIVTPNEGLHEISQAVDKLHKTLSGWSDSGKLGVISRDGDRMDGELRQWIQEEEVKRGAGNQESGSSS